MSSQTLFSLPCADILICVENGKRKYEKGIKKTIGAYDVEVLAF